MGAMKRIFGIIEAAEDFGGVRVVNICDLPGMLDLSVSYDEQTAKLDTFLAVAGAEYYARPRESFFVYEAVELAKAAGKAVVVVEDLS